MAAGLWGKKLQILTSFHYKLELDKAPGLRGNSL